MAAESKPIEAKVQQASISKAPDSVKKSQVASKSAVLKTIDAAAKTAHVAAKSAIASKAVAIESVAPKTAQLAPAAEEDEEEEDEEDETETGMTKTSSLAMPSNYVPPQLKLGELPISFAADTVKGGGPCGKKAMVKMGGLPKKRKKKKKGLKGAQGKDVVLKLVELSMLPGEREKLDGGKHGKRKYGKLAANPWTPAKRRAVCIGTAMAILVAVILVSVIISVVLSQAPPAKPTPSTPNPDDH